MAFSSPNTGQIIPYYNPNAQDTQLIVAQKQAYPAVPVCIIINPYNGPDTQAQVATWSPIITAARAVGVEVILGYIPTGYGGNSLASMEQQVQEYSEWYTGEDALDGIFFDELENPTSNYYSTVYQPLVAYTRTLYSNVYANPGAICATAYMALFDNLCIFENNSLPTPSGLTSNSQGYPRTKCTWMAIQQTALNTSIIADTTSIVQWVYQDDLPDANAYQDLPPYFSQMMAYLDTLAAGTSPPPPPPPPSVQSTYISNFAAVQVGQVTGGYVDIDLTATLLTTSNVPVPNVQVSFYWAPEPFGAYELAGQATTDAQGNAALTSPVSLNATVGDTYSLKASFAGDSTYNSATSTISYTPPTTGVTTDSTAISSFIAQLSGSIINPIITLTGSLVDTTTGKTMPGQQLTIDVNGQDLGQTNPTTTQGGFVFTLTNLSPNTTYNITVGYPGSSSYSPSSASVSVTTGGGTSPPPSPPPAFGGNSVLAAGAAIGAVVVLGTAGYFMTEKPRRRRA